MSHINPKTYVSKPKLLEATMLAYDGVASISYRDLPQNEPPRDLLSLRKRQVEAHRIYSASCMTAHENAETSANQHTRTSDEIIQESSLESFPASDPPAWVHGTDQLKAERDKKSEPNPEQTTVLTNQTRHRSLIERVMAPVRKILRAALGGRIDADSGSKSSGPNLMR